MRSLPSRNADSFRKCLRPCELSSIQPAIQRLEPWFELIEIGGSSTEPAADKKGLELRRRVLAEKLSAPLAASRWTARITPVASETAALSASRRGPESWPLASLSPRLTALKKKAISDLLSAC